MLKVYSTCIKQSIILGNLREKPHFFSHPIIIILIYIYLIFSFSTYKRKEHMTTPIF
jgi:hypothetical protein